MTLAWFQLAPFEGSVRRHSNTNVELHPGEKYPSQEDAFPAPDQQQYSFQVNENWDEHMRALKEHRGWPYLSHPQRGQSACDYDLPPGQDAALWALQGLQ